MEKLKLDVALILPKEARACSACLARILESLKHRSGISDVHVDAAEGKNPKLCLHYDPNVLHSDVLRRLVESAGGELAGQFEHLDLEVVGLRHERHAKLVEAALARHSGVLHAAVAFGTR